MQAAVLVHALAKARLFELVTAYEEAISRGPSWRRVIEASVAPRSDIADRLTNAGR